LAAPASVRQISFSRRSSPGVDSNSGGVDQGAEVAGKRRLVQGRKLAEICNEAQAPTAEMAVTPPSIRKSAPTTYADSSDARYTASFAFSTGSDRRFIGLFVRSKPFNASP